MLSETGAQSARDIGLLSVLAYNQILVQRFEDALALYELLRRLDDSSVKWLGGSVYCRLRLGHWREADALLRALTERTLTRQEAEVVARLRQEVAFFADSGGDIHQTQGEA